MKLNISNLTAAYYGLIHRTNKFYLAKNKQSGFITPLK
jgi:hypothetical protein